MADFNVKAERYYGYPDGSDDYHWLLRVGGPSPWGPIQNVMVIASGICAVTTAGHGGIWVDSDKLKEMPGALRVLQSKYAPKGWYEEDCDWAIVVAAFPHLFSDADCHAALETIKAGTGTYDLFTPVWEYVQSSGGAILRAKAARFPRQLPATIAERPAKA